MSHDEPATGEPRTVDIDLRRDTFKRGTAYRTEHYGVPSMRPMLFRDRPLALLMSGRAASTFAVKWFLHHHQIPIDPEVWPHRIRTQILTTTPWHNDKATAVIRGELAIPPLLRIARDPYKRAVSSFLHSLRQTRPREPVAEVLGIGLDEPYSFERYLTAMETLVPQGRCDEHGYLQRGLVETFAPLDRVYRVEDGLDSLRAVERHYELPETSAADYERLRQSSHVTVYDTNDDYVGDRPFPISPEIPDLVPATNSFYGPMTIALVNRIYAHDFDVLGYARRSHAEPPPLST